MSSRSSATAVALAVSLLAQDPLAQSPPATSSQASLQQDIDAIVAAPAFERAFWGVLVRPVGRDETLYAMNAGKLMTPASTMKVATLAAAAEKLGWDFTYQTRLFASGPIDGGSLHGDLIVVGSGDPSIDDWDGKAAQLFADWAAQLKSAGISRVDGRIIGDDNAFDDDGLGQGWAWDDIATSFSASVSALQFNQGSVQLRLAPGTSVGTKAGVTVSPDYSGLTLSNLITTGAAGSTPAIARRRFPGSSRLELRGVLPVRTRPFSETASVDNPTQYFVTALRRSLVANGIDVEGPAVDIDDLDLAPARAADPLITYQSPPLSALATTMMRLSQNLYAETLLKTLGVNGGPGTAEAGRMAVRSVLQSWNIDAGGVIQADGSGLSRYNLITPDAMVAILTHVGRDERLRSAFEASLPVAGRNGTLENRMRGTRAEGTARVKTGSLTSVRAMAGYVRTADGETLAFAIFVNNYDNSSNVINAACDAIVVRLASFRRVTVARLERPQMKTAEIESHQDQLLSIRQDATGLMSGLSDAQFNWQPEPGRWSMSGCFDHLNLSAANLFMPSIDAAIATARAQNLKSNGPFVYSAFERWCVRTNDAPAGMRFRAPKPVQPVPGKPVDEVRAEFLRWQDELGKRLMEADGLDLRRAKHKSPIPLVKWSLGAYFQLMLAHERRHVWQARLIRQNPAFPA